MQDKYGFDSLVTNLGTRTVWSLMLEMVANRITSTTTFTEGSYNHTDPTAYERAYVYIGFDCDPHVSSANEDGPPSPACYMLNWNDVTWGVGLTLTRYVPDCIEEPGAMQWVWDVDWDGNPPGNIFNGEVYLDAGDVRDQVRHEEKLAGPEHKALLAFLTYALCAGQWYDSRKAYEVDNTPDPYEEHYGRNV